MKESISEGIMGSSFSGHARTLALALAVRFPASRRERVRALSLLGVGVSADVVLLLAGVAYWLVIPIEKTKVTCVLLVPLVALLVARRLPHPRIHRIATVLFIPPVVLTLDVMVVMNLPAYGTHPLLPLITVAS